MNDGRNIVILALTVLALLLVVIVGFDTHAILSAPSPYETITHAQGQRDIIEREIAEMRAKGNDILVAQTNESKLIASTLADHTQHLQDLDSDMATLQSMLSVPKHRTKK